MFLEEDLVHKTPRSATKPNSPKAPDYWRTVVSSGSKNSFLVWSTISWYCHHRPGFYSKSLMPAQIDNRYVRNFDIHFYNKRIHINNKIIFHYLSVLSFIIKLTFFFKCISLTRSMILNNKSETTELITNGGFLFENK